MARLGSARGASDRSADCQQRSHTRPRVAPQRLVRHSSWAGL